MGSNEMLLAVVAAVIAGFVLLGLGAVQLRSQEASIDAVQYRAAKRQMLDLAQIMQRDFGNVGANMYRNGAGGFTGGVVETKDAIDSSNALQKQAHPSLPAETVGHFEFLSQQDSMAGPVTVRYEWAPLVGQTVTLNDATEEQLYRVRRLVNGTLTLQNDLITAFDVALMSHDTSMVKLTNLDDARVIDVAVTAVSPLGKGTYIEETVFEATYRPVAMTITDNN